MAILKYKEHVETDDKFMIAAEKAESQISFYLTRAFKDSDEVFVFNDLRFSKGNDNCQIDHLVIHRFGGIVIESKSVTSKVSINKRNEWARYWDGQWKGMPSPILQAKNQIEFLRMLLRDNVENLRDKLLGLFQKQFGCFSIDAIVAISNSGIVEIDDEAYVQEVVKAELVVDKVKEIIDKQKKMCGFLKVYSSDMKISVSKSELESICSFFLETNNGASIYQKTDKEKCIPIDTTQLGETSLDAKANPPIDTSSSVNVSPPAEKIQFNNKIAVAEDNITKLKINKKCYKCSSENVYLEYGKYGYYWKCIKCSTNTKLTINSQASLKGKVKKSGSKFYYLTGTDNQQMLFFHDNSEAVHSCAETGRLKLLDDQCKHCDSKNMQIMPGKFGYYWKCKDCSGNTPTSKIAPDGSEGSIKKDKDKFYFQYGKENKTLILIQSGASRER